CGQHRRGDDEDGCEATGTGLGGGPVPGERVAVRVLPLAAHARDAHLGTAEDIVRATPLDWTIARPPRLIERPDEAYRSRRDALPVDGFSMSFRAVAAFMLDAAEHHAHLREIVGLAS